MYLTPRALKRTLNEFVILGGIRQFYVAIEKEARAVRLARLCSVETRERTARARFKAFVDGSPQGFLSHESVQEWKVDTLCDLYETLTITQAIIYCSSADKGIQFRPATNLH